MKIGIQLYTLRDHLGTKDEFLATLDRVAAMGYQGVEVACVGCMEGDSPTVTVAEGAGFIKERGLEVIGAHRGWDNFEKGIDEEIAYLTALGAPFVAIPVPPAGIHEGGVASYRRWLSDAKGASDTLKAHGITLAYHNHAMEFERFGEKGERPYDVLVNEAPWLAMEVDTYWVHHSGSDLLSILRKLSGRLPVVHLKDVAPFGWEVTFAPVGEGNLDWAAILATLNESGTQWTVVEQDSTRRDVFDCIESSIRFLKR